MVDVDLDREDGAARVLRAFRARNDRAPVFLFGQRSQISAVPLEHAQDGGRVHLAARRLSDADGRTSPSGGPALPRAPAAADVLRHASARGRPRVHVRHAGPPRRHRLSEDAGVEGVLRLLRRESAALGSVHRHGARRLAAPPQRSDWRKREIRRPRLRRRSLVHGDERHLDAPTAFCSWPV